MSQRGISHTYMVQSFIPYAYGTKSFIYDMSVTMVNCAVAIVYAACLG